MNILSLFDGMSCGQIALDQLGFKVNNYYASEVDKFAIKVAKENYPNTIHLGDVREVKAAELEPIDLLLGGSPCQGFSFAGKQLNFEDPRSALFFEYVRLLKETKPKYFLLENVRMKQEYQDVISEYLGVKPIMINSALVSAQNRVRLYWTNIPNIEQPRDKGIVLKDILEDYYEKPVIDQTPRGANKGGITSSSMKKGKTPSLTPSSWQHNNHLCELREFKQESTCHHAATATDIKGNESIKRVYADSGKCPTLTTMGGGHREPKVLCDTTTYRKLTPMECERLQTVPDNYTDGVSNTQRYKMLGNGWTVDVIAHILRGIL